MNFAITEWGHHSILSFPDSNYDPEIWSANFINDEFLIWQRTPIYGVNSDDPTDSSFWKTYIFKNTPGDNGGTWSVVKTIDQLANNIAMFSPKIITDHVQESFGIICDNYTITQSNTSNRGYTKRKQIRFHNRNQGGSDNW